jgi:hypothetical protein
MKEKKGSGNLEEEIKDHEIEAKPKGGRRKVMNSRKK